MLLLNFLRALAILAGIGLYHIYNIDFLTVWQGLVIFLISFFGLSIYDIVEEKVVEEFNSTDPENPD